MYILRVLIINIFSNDFSVDFCFMENIREIIFGGLGLFLKQLVSL